MPVSKNISISPSQGLLILIDKYKNNPEKVGRLKQLYVCGATNKAEKNEIIEILKDPALSQFNVSYNPEMINNDPTRRYFETHLAYDTLRNKLGSIAYNDLNDHFQSLKRMLPKNYLEYIKHVLKGEIRENDAEIFKEYADYIAKINSGVMFNQLSPNDREKIELLVKCSLLGVLNAKFNKLPIDIYGKGIYFAKNKGKT